MSEGLEVGKQVDSSGAGSDQWAAAQGLGGRVEGPPSFPGGPLPPRSVSQLPLQGDFSAARLAFSLPPSPPSFWKLPEVSDPVGHFCVLRLQPKAGLTEMESVNE